MFSVTNIKGNSIFNWRNTGTPTASSPQQLHNKQDDLYLDLVLAARGKDNTKYQTAIGNWLELLNDAMILSADEKKTKLDFEKKKGLRAKKVTKEESAFLAATRKTKMLPLPGKVSDKAMTVSTLVHACKLIAKYLCALVDAKLVDDIDNTHSETYTACCSHFIHLTLIILITEMKTDVPSKDKVLITSTVRLLDKTIAAMHSEPAPARFDTGLADVY